MEIHQQVKNQQTSNFQDFPQKVAMRPPSRPKSSQNDRQLRQLGSEPPVLVSFSAGLWGRLQGMVAVGLKPTNKHQKIGTIWVYLARFWRIFGFWGQKPTKKKKLHEDSTNPIYKRWFTGIRWHKKPLLSLFVAGWLKWIFWKTEVQVVTKNDIRHFRQFWNWDVAQNMRNAHDFLGRQLVIVGGKGLQMVDFISS